MKHRQIILEIILNRYVENYLNYLSSLLFEIYTQRPETLRSSDQVEVESVLSHDSIESFTKSFAEKKVESLTYKSFDELDKYFRDRFKLDVSAEQARQKIIEAIETRNISVHNRCIINRRYVVRVGLEESQIGKRKKIHGPDLDTIIPLIGESVRSLDVQARKKLKLKAIRFKIVPFSIT